MENPQVKFTYRDYLLLPEQDRRELIEGDFYYMPPAPNVEHQNISMNLGLPLAQLVRRNRLGIVLMAPMDVVLDNYNVVQPDILYISNERRHIITAANISEAPDLVIEILSPSTAERDRELKRKLYKRFGVREHCVVGPELRVVQVIDLETDAIKTYTSGAVSSAVLPELQVSVEEIFAGY
jgi:Uma2 family endonuclease